MFKKTTLKNGLRIITVPQKNTQAVTVLVLVGTGSKYETKEINGVSHFLEHMYFKGTRKRPSSLAIAETLDKVGGIYNAFTGEEYTGYFAKVAANYFDLSLDLVSDIFLHSTLPAEEINKERGVIIEEINMRQDHPIEHVQALWMKLLYGDQPAGWDIAGTKESVSAIQREALAQYMNNQYVASNTIISVAGKIKENSVIKRIKKYFARIKTTKPLEKPRVTDSQIQPNLLLETKKTDQTHLCLGVRAFNVFHPQKYAQDLLAVILGGMMSSRLFEEIRSKLGIAYYISASSEANTDTGFLMAQAGLDNKNVEKGILTILKEYKKISQKRIPFTELKKVKDYLKGKTTLLLEASDAQASFYASQELLEKEILTPKEIFTKIDKVSSEDIFKLAKEIFRPEKLNLALIGPFEDKEKFQRLLNSYH
ncbi:insulinase family protein [Patescibacteria group bacterium]|nr:insulinase family protein [Patescibacteria group bacterium]MBU4480752.1 insulinase family protein [Patescibacteria group bacterium]